MNLFSLPFNEKPTMLVGMDVYHKTSGRAKKSIFSFVSTTDKHYSKFYLILFLNFLIAV